MSRRRRGWEDTWDDEDGVDPDLDDADEFLLDDEHLPALIPTSHPGRRPGPSAPSSWSERLAALNRAMQGPAGGEPWPPEHHLVYVIDVIATMEGYGLVLEVLSRQRKQDGSWRDPRSAKIQSSQLATLPDEADRRILSLLMGAKDAYGLYGYPPYGQSPHTYRLSSTQQDTLLPMVCATGRCMLRRGSPAHESCGPYLGRRAPVGALAGGAACAHGRLRGLRGLPAGE